jgi:hypothetical protein
MAKLKNTEVIETLKTLAERNSGILMPEEVVRAAEPENSILHTYFTWDDSEAARKCRLQEARQLINVCVEYIGTENQGHETRVFVSLRDDRQEGGYRPLVTVLKNPTLRDSLLQDSLEEMSYFREKFKGLRELAAVIAAMNTTERRILGKKRPKPKKKR